MSPTIPKLADEQIYDLIDHHDRLDNQKKAISEAIKLLTVMAMDEKKPADKSEFDEAVAVLREAASTGTSLSEDLQKTKLLLLGQLNDKVDQKSSKVATVSRTQHVSYTAEDITQLKAYSERSGDWGWVTASIGKDWCAEYEQTHDEVPPGVEKFSEWRLKFSRKRKKV